MIGAFILNQGTGLEGSQEILVCGCVSLGPDRVGHGSAGRSASLVQTAAS